jgi:hypothetical protein
MGDDHVMDRLLAVNLERGKLRDKLASTEARLTAAEGLLRASHGYITRIIDRLLHGTVYEMEALGMRMAIHGYLASGPVQATTHPIPQSPKGERLAHQIPPHELDHIPGVDSLPDGQWPAAPPVTTPTPCGTCGGTREVPSLYGFTHVSPCPECSCGTPLSTPKERL